MRTPLASGSSLWTIGTGKRTAALAFWAGCAMSGPADATALYDAGTLVFDTVGQSMWGPGTAPVFADSVFVGPQWTNRTVGVGGFTGSLSTVTINTNPAWWAWKACQETIFPCGPEPSKGQVREVIDTRTGARVDLVTSGKFGLEFGYTINSGTVDAAALYDVSAVLPDTATAGAYLSLNPDGTRTGASLASQSPWIEAHIDAIAQLSGSVSARACLILSGCTPTGTAALPALDLDQNVLRIDPNSIKVLDELLPPNNPGELRQPLAEVKLANQTLTLQAAVTAAATPGFKLTTSQFTLLDTTGGVPGVTIDLASIEFKLPNIATSSAGLTSSGRDDVVKLRADVDGLAFVTGAGAIPPLGIGLTLIDAGGFKVGMQFDGLDIDIGPDIGITQDFELTPTLMARLDFSSPLLIEGLAGPRSFWEGAWEALPRIALLETTTFTPTFWVEAMLKNTIGIDLGLTGNWDIYKFGFTAEAAGVTILGTTPVSLNTLLGLGNTLFATPKLRFPVFDRTFDLLGFGRIPTAAFTIAVAAVPAPGTLALVFAALGVAAIARRRLGAQGGRGPTGCS
ncbi:MAG: PEP-CTERM sorting domain-containing protein [Gammaproteobacteria bacterium]|nr:PEP-CTERM sorting domain-containing protein [Gammaproteobacteria bacterium]